MAYVYIYIIAYITYMCPGPAAVRLSVCGPCLEALSLQAFTEHTRHASSPFSTGSSKLLPEVRVGFGPL